MLCKICNKRNLYPLFKNVIDPLTNDSFEIKICSCGIAQTIFENKKIENYYPEYYRKFNKYTTSLLSLFYKHKVFKWNKFFKNPGNILEIGCGHGYMLREFEKLNWKIFGTERNKKQIDIALKNVNNLTIKSRIKSFKQKKFDLIVLFHVLEHMQDPLNELKMIRNVLKKGSLIVISVPNLSSWQAKLFKKNWLHLDVPRHLCHFKKKALKQILIDNNFSVIKESHISFEHDPIGWIESSLNYIFKDKNYITKLLSSNKKFNTIKILLFLVLLVPSLLLSLFSWYFGKGAVVEILARYD